MVRIHGPSDRLPGFLNSAPTLRRPTAPPLVNAPLDGDIRQSKVRHDRDFIVHGPFRNVQRLRKMLRIFSLKALPASRKFWGGASAAGLSGAKTLFASTLNGDLAAVIATIAASQLMQARALQSTTKT